MKNEEAAASGGSDWEALEERLLDFGARVGLVVDALPDTRMGRHVAGQLVRCGTAAGQTMRKVAQRKVARTSFTSWESCLKSCGRAVFGCVSA